MKFVVLIVIAILNLIGWFYDLQDFDDLLFVFPLISIVCSLLFVWPKTNKGKVEIKLLYFVLFGILFFNAPLYFMALADSDELSNILLRYSLDKASFIKANFLLGINLPLIICGYLMPIKKESKKKYDIRALVPIKTNVFIVLFFVYFMFSLSVTGWTLGSTFDGVSSYNYIVIIRLSVLVITIILYNELIRSSFVSKKYSPVKIVKRNIGGFSIIFLFIIYALIGGDRGPVLVLLLIIGLGYLLLNNMMVKKKILVYLVGVYIVLGTLFTFIEVLRQSGNETVSAASIEKSLDSFKDYESIPGLIIRNTTLAIMGIERGIYPHSYGFFQFQALAKGVPYFGIKLIDNLVGGRVINGTAELLTIQYYGSFYTSGLGTSHLADIYIEFGLIGVILISFGYGYLIRIFDFKCKHLHFKNFSDILLLTLFAGYSIYTGRGTLFGFATYFIHTWIFYILIKYVFSMLGYNFNKRLK